MTDNEIIKALECLHKRILQSKFAEEVTETEIMGLVGALDLINRQKAEIERLKEYNETLLTANVDLWNEILVIKSEAIKEFAERGKKTLSEFDMSSVGIPDYDRGYSDCKTAIEDVINDLEEEMTEE